MVDSTPKAAIWHKSTINPLQRDFKLLLISSFRQKFWDKASNFGTVPDVPGQLAPMRQGHLEINIRTLQPLILLFAGNLSSIIVLQVEYSPSASCIIAIYTDMRAARRNILTTFTCVIFCQVVLMSRKDMAFMHHTLSNQATVDIIIGVVANHDSIQCHVIINFQYQHSSFAYLMCSHATLLSGILFCLVCWLLP